MGHKTLGCLLSVCLGAAVNANAAEYLVKFQTTTESVGARVSEFQNSHGGKLTLVSEAGNLYKWTTEKAEAMENFSDKEVAYVSPNRVIRLPESPALQEARREWSARASEGKVDLEALIRRQEDTDLSDNPAFHAPAATVAGKDPMIEGCWGLFNSGADRFWTRSSQGKGIIVAVTDTGVDYNHEDLISNMWRNPKEKEDGIDNDGNGYVDDMVGWDFAVDDNKPYDLTTSLWRMLLLGGNPGHGTHVSGVIGAKLRNSLGVSGVAPQVQIMALRFLTESGQGTTEGAIRAIDYAVNNGAKIINASWGGESDGSDQALVDAIERAHKAGVIFVAAAGNGRNGVGFDIDNDAKAVYPAAIDLPNVVTVAALNSEGELAGFSNWGKKSVKIGAPGVKILSTVPGDNYSDTVLDLYFMQVTWDGTSMATPFVAGSLAVVWSQNPSATWSDVKEKVLRGAKANPVLIDKVATAGQLDLSSLH